MIELSLVRCSNDEKNTSEIVSMSTDLATLEEKLISKDVQELEANLARGLHLAADQPDHGGPVTYVQEILEGGFFVYVGNPDALEEHWFGPGTWVAFNDNQGTGHASKVGPDGCKRMFRMLRGQLDA